MGTGYYSIDGRTAFVVRINPSFRLRSEEGRAWGVSLWIPITLGFFDFKLEDLYPPEFRIPERIASVSIAPGVLFRVPIRDNWMLFPFTFFGPAKDLESKEFAWVLSLGSRSRAEFPWGPRKMILWNRLQWASNYDNQRLFDDDLAVFESDFEVRQPITAKTAIGGLLVNDYYINAVVVLRPGESFEIRDRWEVGATYGPMDPMKLWKIPVPRLSVGYRWGQGTEGIRINLRFRY